MDRLGLHEGRSRCVPGGQAAATIGIRRRKSAAEHPDDLDVLAVRAEHAVAARNHLGQAEQEAVVDVGQSEARALATAAVHEDLEARDAVVLGIV
jgi:hypothetical protein